MSFQCNTIQGVYVIFHFECAPEVRQSQKIDKCPIKVCYMNHFFISPTKSGTYYCNLTPKMARTEAELQGLVKKVVMVKYSHPTLSILATIKVAKLTVKEVKDNTLQMRCMLSLLTQQLNNYLQWWNLIIDEYGGQKC